jgi:hypothetical protein
LIKLPGDSGFVEVVVEDTRSSPRSIAREVVAYFYGPDSKSPLSPAPTDVAVEVYLAESKTRGTIPLKPAEAADGATVGRRFAAASPPGFDGFIRSGKLLSRHEGREFNIAF